MTDILLLDSLAQFGVGLTPSHTKRKENGNFVVVGGLYAIIGIMLQAIAPALLARTATPTLANN